MAGAPEKNDRSAERRHKKSRSAGTLMEIRPERSLTSSELNINYTQGMEGWEEKGRVGKGG